MSKKAISITTVVILLILVAVVAPYFIGAKVETEFREGIAQAKTEYGYPIELTDYERGWLHSHAVTRVQIEDTTFDVEHEITHGPLFVFGWARIHSALPNDISPEMAHFFDESPLVANTKLGFGGGYRIGIQSPAFDKDVPDEPGVHLTWQGLKGYYARHDNEVDLQLNGGGLKLDAENRHLVVDDIQVSGDGSAMENIEEADAKLDWDSRFEAKLGHYRMYDDAGAFDLAYGMRLHANTANGDNDTVEFHAGYDITDLQLKAKPDDGDPIDVSVDQAAIKLGLTGLKAGPLQEAVVALREIDPSQHSPERVQALSARVFTELAPEILAGTPKLSVTIPPVETGHGEAQGKVSAGLISNDELPPEVADMRRRMPVLAMAQRLTLDADVFVDEQLIDWVTKNLASENPAMARELPMQITGMVRQGFLMREDDAVGVRLHAGKDEVVLNGQTIPARQLQPLFESLMR